MDLRKPKKFQEIVSLKDDVAFVLLQAVVLTSFGWSRKKRDLVPKSASPVTGLVIVTFDLLDGCLLNVLVGLCWITSKVGEETGPRPLLDRTVDEEGSNTGGNWVEVAGSGGV